jgi:hypothetical protein
MRCLIFTVTLLVSTGLVESIKLAILLSLRDSGLENTESTFIRAQALDPTVTSDVMKEEVAQLFSLFTIPVWFHDVLMAGSMVGASEDEIFESILTRATAIGEREIKPETTRKRIRLFMQFCIIESNCNMDEEGKNWVLPKQLCNYYVRRLIHERTSREYGPHLKPELLSLLRQNIRITPVQVADELRITVQDALAGIENVLRIYTQPEWFLDLLLKCDSKRLDYASPVIQTIVMDTVKQTGIKYNGVLKEALRAWISLVALPMRNHNQGNLVTRQVIIIKGKEVNFLSINSDVVQRYI